jgi:hypothetical protein
MSEFKDVSEFWQDKLPFDLKTGNCIVIYTDKGPGGPCGQSMSVTCPHAMFAVFEDRDAMEKWAQSCYSTRQGDRADIRWWEVGQGGHMAG